MDSIRNLIGQFRMSKGYINSISGKEMSEFVTWLDRQKKIGKKYCLLLEEMGVKIDTESCAEVGKTYYDTVVSNLKTSVITLSNYIETKGYLIKSGFRVYNGNPIAVRKKTEKKVSFGQINTNIINTFITQNPYNDVMIENWNELPKNDDISVVVGMYGSTKDKDIKIKKERLINFRDKLVNYIYEERVYDDEYCFVVASKNYEKKLVIK